MVVRKMSMTMLLLVSALCLLFVAASFASEIVVQNNAGVKYTAIKNKNGYAFGAVTLNGAPVESPLQKGMIRFLNTQTNEEYWFHAADGKLLSGNKAEFKGKGTIDGTTINFVVTVEVPDDVHAVRMLYDFKVNKDLENVVACLQFNDTFDNQWKAHLYPWVEDSKWIEREKLDNMGIPSAFLYRDDRSMGMLWGIDPNSDYLNPTTWTGDFGLYFIDAVMPAQFRVGGEKLQKNIDYSCPMQIVLTEKRDPDEMVIDVVQHWMKVNDYKVEPLFVRTNDEALYHFIEGRREETEAYIPGKGYSLHGARHTFLYFGVQGLASYFDYTLYEVTGNSMWRNRAFEMMDFIVQGQNRDKTDFNYGAVHTTFQLRHMDDYGPHEYGFNSDDRWNIGYKPDIVSLLARWMLETWKLVKEHEGIDRQDWYETAILAVDWIIRQQNNDGGLPQKVQAKPLEMRWMDDESNLVIKPFKSRSSTSGRALPSLHRIYEITGDKRYKKFLESLEEYTLQCVQNQYYFTSHHPDLPPYEFEEASIWGVCEYWLNRYEETGDPKYLTHAEANAYLSLTWWCPKQLSWVDNPTQGGSAEQQHFQQYSVYNYQNRKVESLYRLHQLTSNPLYGELHQRVLQNIYFTQRTESPNRGGTYERIADPWLVRAGDYEDREPSFNSMGVNYTNEQALDCIVQTFQLYRSGYDVYFGEGMNSKVYHDGMSYYSKDISTLTKVPLHVVPSTGSIRLTVTSFDEGALIWTVGEATDAQISLTCDAGDFEKMSWVKVYVDGELVGQYQANPEGKIAFSYTGDFSSTRTFELK